MYKKNALYFSFPSVYPEPVLANSIVW
eukprot:COSAG06_NODE_27501_length_592_cov_0.685598_1_plen_26_part_01